MKILIADDHALYRDGLRVNLNRIFPDAKIIDAINLAEILAILKQDNDFTFTLLDLNILGNEWEKNLNEIKNILPTARIGIISTIEDGNIIKKALNLNVCCYLPKNIDSKVLSSTLNLVLNGGTYFPTSLLNHSTENANLPNGKKLTNRQFEVLKYLSQGLSNKQIAYQMNVSEATVKLHINALLRAVGATNRTQAVIKAQKIGVI